MFSSARGILHVNSGPHATFPRPFSGGGSVIRFLRDPYLDVYRTVFNDIGVRDDPD